MAHTIRGKQRRTAEGRGFAEIIVLNDQGGARMDVTVDFVCTLRAQSNHPPLIFDARGNGGGGYRSDHHGRSPEPGDGLYRNRGDL